MESNVLDLSVARALMHWRLVERALHDRGPWTMQYAEITVPVSRFIRADRVSFVAHFPPMCLLHEPELTVSLFCGDDLLRVCSLEGPLDEDGSEVWFDLYFDDVPAQVS